MRRVVIFAASLFALSACTAEPVPAPVSSVGAPASTVTEPPSAQAPPAPEPVADGPCPYLESTAVADANGQRVTKVRISADKPHPACFFYRPDGTVQLTVRIYLGEPAIATAIVDEAAPRATSDPARSPQGWEGGSLSGEKGAVYAVAKDKAAVVVTSNQAQTIKARRIVEAVVAELGL
ncbi:DUF2020 domain-containing protein [Actinokineospora xionganensis]|uniref:DUF2020 domain-containing protein n=1 Tax=Actinokineospora xionganensis TaxID=2684470 RepID=A0ABR7L960_9PSEU|nr:DUF2020 domain-containing protein [Actinokineospora xionganensis]MBC6449233.1 DUF2020 domain-containing protein [Actinokineospora xionganensis]